MPSEAWIGAVGVVLVAAAVVLRRKSPKKRAAVVASLLASAGWTLVAHFWIQPLVPAPVMAGILLGGMTLGIFLAAIIGGRSGRAKRPPSDDRRSTTEL